MIYVIDPGNISENPFTGGRFAAGEWYYFDPETCISRNYGSGNVDLNTLSWACTHVNAEKTYTDNKDGKQHIAKWSCCGTEVTEAHTGGTATCTTKAVCEACGASYGELDPNNHEYEKYNGICCDTYQSATLNADGYYEISNAGQLFWFAQQINKVDRTLSAVLTADIDLENRPWTPIGSTGENSHNFRGVFDGQNHTIRGLYVEGGRAGLGFFGEVRTGTVKNFTIYGEVVANTEVNYVGGVIGSACGLNGDNDLERNGAVIQNITSYVNLTAKAHGIGMVGGFVGYANHETLIENCSWYGTFDAGIYRVDSGAGGFIGRIYDSASVTIRNCGAYGTVKTAYQSGTFDNQATIYIGGFLSYSPSGAKTVMENNLWAGKIINNTNLTAANAHLSAYGTLSSNVSTTNCYALEGTPYVTTGNDNADGITTVTAEQLKSGEVAYKLGAAWGQTIGTDDYPILGGAKVYYGYADIILANESGSASFTKAQPMVQAMLNYGAYAQVDFGYNTDNLAADLSQADVSGVTAQTLSGFANANKQGTALAPLYAATLVLKTETTLRLFFQVDASVTNLTVTRGETSLTVSDKSGLKYCALENISAKDLDADYTITVNDGTESANVTYNPMSYCYNVLNAAEGTYSDSLLNAVRALYLYNLAANAYFG